MNFVREIYIGSVNLYEALSIFIIDLVHCSCYNNFALDLVDPDAVITHYLVGAEEFSQVKHEEQDQETAEAHLASDNACGDLEVGYQEEHPYQVAECRNEVGEEVEFLEEALSNLA